MTPLAGVDKEDLHPESASGYPMLEITDVLQLPYDADVVAEHYLDSPVPGWKAPVYALDIAGWVLFGDVAGAFIEVATKTGVIASVPVQEERTDIATAFPSAPTASQSGFAASMSTLGLPRQFELELYLVTSDNRRTPLWRIAGTRRMLPPADLPGLAPLLVVTLGRSGSTYLMSLLGCHPEILAYQPSRLEPRPVGYWTSVLLELSQPSSYMLPASGGSLRSRNWWTASAQRAVAGIRDPAVEQWLGRDNIEAVARFCASQVSGLYDVMKASVQGSRPRYVAEKSGAEFLASVGAELFPNSRILFLVRDLRDVAASVLAFNRKRGHDEFGRERVDGDLDFFDGLRRSANSMFESWCEQADRSLLVRYEDLVRDPVEAMARVYEHLALSTETPSRTAMSALGRWDEAVIEHATSRGPVESVGRWQREFSEQMKERAEMELGPLLEGFGYE